ncbi:MAG TPA: glycosyltransferase family 1 protein [Chloroflexia bacterium]|nr:glycosyltransferase family 1 protein [Chloroflexia bacterium]
MAQIGIDASRALTAQRTGTEHYSAALIYAMSLLDEARSLDVTLYVNAPLGEAGERLGFPLPASWGIRAIPFPRLWTHLRLSREMALNGLSTLFVPSHVVPLWHPRNTVVTIHDLGYLYYPQAHSRRSRLYLHLSTIFSVRAARRVIAISEATRRDLISKYRVPPRKIRVIYHGRDNVFRPVADQTTIRRTAEQYGVTQPYCIHVGTLQPRKNLGLLVDAWAEMRSRGQEPPQLLLAGKRGWLYDELISSVEARGLGGLIKFADYVQREDLPALYSGALALTFPSLYEGFGLPALEAMSCGTPVLAANASSLPEVVGNAGILLDPHHHEPWADAVIRIRDDQTLRDELSGRGLRRAAAFTWEKCARETLGVLLERGKKRS